MEITLTDLFLDCVLEYNATVTDPKRAASFKRFTKNELRGIFYNTMRRRIKLSSTYRESYLQVDAVECTFNEDLTLNRVYISSAYDSWNWQDDVSMKSRLHNVTKQLPTLYSMKILNEMALIVNQIKV